MSELNLKIPLEETANLAAKLKEERDEARELLNLTQRVLKKLRKVFNP